MNALVILCISLSLVSCSSDDDDDEKNEISIVGKWELVESNIPTASKTLTFNSDQTGLDGSDKMTWVLDGKSLTVETKGATAPATFTILSLTEDELRLQWFTYVLKYKRVN
ncbi:MAG: lipocalin family protein [Bacillus cereus]|nr:lipocalin family protein [Bacillus cereus]